MVTIGADPEVFIVDSATLNATPICSRVGGTKEAPLQLGGGYAVQEDNVMLEYNIPPTSSARDFASSILEGWRAARRTVKGPAIEAYPYDHAVVNFPTKSIQHFKSAFRFGCAPDYDAYSRGNQTVPVSPQSLYVQDTDTHRRMAGGHIHLGYDNPNKIPDWVVAQLCDYFVYVHCLNQLGAPNQGPRGESYGQAGRYRPTKYGIEYRTPSNWWVVSTTKGNGVVARAVGAAALLVGSMVEQLDQHLIKEFIDGVDWLDVRTAVLTGGRGQLNWATETACLPTWNAGTLTWED